MNAIVLAILFSVSLLHAVNTKDSELGGRIEEGIGPLFVSLGSYCETAHVHRECGIRKAAFPFDWIISFDGEKLLEILEDDFLHFLNPHFLRVYGASLLNDYYHLEFLNEGDWEDADYKIEEFSRKCQRRIDRFRNLGNYPGKVFFVRTSYPRSLVDPNRIWRIEENIEITRLSAEKLYQKLKNYFPCLDFDLIIMNLKEMAGFEVDEATSDHLLMVRIDGKIGSYKNFYHLLNEKEQALRLTPSL